MTYQFQPGDYIAFNRIVQPERPCRHRTDYATGRPIVVPAIAEQILHQRGNAQITTITAAPRKVKTPDGVVTVRTARAAAGKPLGTVTVILDDAVLVAKQQGLFEMDAFEQVDAHGQYSTDAKGIA